MKIRRDFVTNSSSSSYIVKFNKDPKIDISLIEKRYIEKVTKENLKEIIENTYDVWYYSSDEEEARIKEFFNFTDEQMYAMMLMKNSDALETYMKLMEELKKDSIIYLISPDGYESDKCYEIIENGETIAYERM